jgi:hypothetical protein
MLLFFFLKIQTFYDHSLQRVTSTGINHLVGGKPWQSSTMVFRSGKRLSAGKALDGRPSNIVNDCAHTDSYFSYWAVENCRSC